MKSLLIALLIVLAGGPAAISQSRGPLIDTLMRAYAENEQFNGTILVKHGGDVVYQHAFGLANREWGIPNIMDAKFLAGSIGKSMTAFMIMLLVNDGSLDLHKTINEYIPNYTGPGKNVATIHQLLTHTSGIPDHGAIPNLSKKLVRWTYDTEQYLALIQDIPLKFEPGTGFAYSGIAYNLLAIICEKITGKDFAVLLRERLFLPLGMTNSSHDKNLDIDFHRAFGYEYHLLEGYMNPSFIDMSLIKGSGGILTTTDDLAKFNHECFSAHTLLARDLYDRIFTRHVHDWQYYGYGWWITDKIIGNDTLTLISHGGSTDGYKAYNTRILEDSIDIILLQNNYYRTELGVKFDYAITNEIIDILHGKVPALPKTSIAKKMGYAISHGGIDTAIATYHALKSDPRYFIDAQEFHQLGQELHQRYHLLETSRRVYALAVREFPESFILHYAYGVLLVEVGDSNADGQLRTAIDIYNAHPENARYAHEYEHAGTLLRKK